MFRVLYVELMKLKRTDSVALCSWSVLTFND